MSAALYAMSAPDLAAQHKITARRVRQYVEDGLMPTLEPGRFDAVFFLYLRAGELHTRNKNTRPNRDTLVALGWLKCLGAEPTADDIQAFTQLFARNGLSRDAAMVALGRAQGH